MMLALIWAASLLATLISYRKDRSRTLLALKKSGSALKNLAPGLLGMIAIVGFALAFFPQDTLLRLFKAERVWDHIGVSLLGAVVTIPGPIAFPLAGTLLKMGAPLPLLASFITTLTMVSVVTAPMEISYFGVRFTLLRQSMSFVAAVSIGLLLGVLL
jgi:uncharacterized membrane protein YraQ (UPF0718 family)